MPLHVRLRARSDGRPWIKICGLRDAACAARAVASGADAVGVVRYAPSPRDASDAEVAAVLAAVDGRVPVVAVTVDASIAELCRLVGLGVRGLQPHGVCDVAALRAALVETAGPVAAEVVVLRPQKVAPDAVVWPPLRAEGADAVLVDAAVPGIEGGSGQTLRWQRPEADAPWILAGGLTPVNVAAAVELAAPFGVDVSSGVESAPGVKDEALIERFCKELR